MPGHVGSLIADPGFHVQSSVSKINNLDAGKLTLQCNLAGIKLKILYSCSTQLRKNFQLLIKTKIWKKFYNLGACLHCYLDIINNPMRVQIFKMNFSVFV